MADTVVVGRVGRPQGVRGEVTVEVRTDAPDERFAPGVVLLTEPAERGPLTVEAARDHSGRLVVRFEGVADRDGAEALRDTLLLVDVSTLAPLDDPDEFHDWQLVGLRAELADGTRIGSISEVLHLPHGDVLVVGRAGPSDGSAAGPAPGGPAPGGFASAGEVLVPFVRVFVPEVDVAGGRIVLDPPSGLLDDSADTETDTDAEA